MSGSPQVSVVMSVYNGAAQLAETIDSVLQQEECDFEFIVINDGSTDETAAILDRYAAADPRLRIVHQDNTGLTRALARGCALARGEFIARQDAGDVSLPGRLALQVRFLIEHPEAVMTSCAVQFSGPLGEPLYQVSMPMRALDDGLRQLDMGKLAGPPHHGATMYRRGDYEAVGGYRLPFVVAQDIDLWLRLAEHGSCVGTVEVLYEARMAMGSISSRRRSEQLRMSELAASCALLRRAGDCEASMLTGYVHVAPPRSVSGRCEQARFYYFIASCLRRTDRAAANRYYRLALRDNPFHLKALWRCLNL